MEPDISLPISTMLPLGSVAAAVSERWEVAPCVCDVVDARRTVGGVPGRSPEGIWEEPLCLAPYQAWRHLHPRTGAGKTSSLVAWPLPPCVTMPFEWLTNLACVSVLLRSGYSGWSIWCNPVVCRGDVRPADVVPCPDSRGHLQPRLLWQPSQRWRHSLVRDRSGTSRRGYEVPLWPLSLRVDRPLTLSRSLGGYVWSLEGQKVK